MAKCPNCGQKLTGKINFCGYCGTNIKTGEQSWALEMEAITKSKSVNSSSNNNLSGDSKPVQSAHSSSSVVNENITPVETAGTFAKSLTPPSMNFETNILTSEPKSITYPAMQDNFETGLLEDEIAEASPVQTISEVKQELPKPNKNFKTTPDVVRNNSASAFSSLSEPVKKSAVEEIKIPEIQSAEKNNIVEIPVAPKLIRVVSCVGLDINTAELMFKRTGLKTKIIRKNNDKIVKNEVISQSAVAGSEVPSDTIITLTISCGTWTNWSDIEPEAEGNEIESKTEYRIRTREKTIERKTSSTSDAIEGYTLCDSKKGYSNWKTEDYFTNISRKTSEICEVVENLIGFKYCGWFYKGGSNIVRNTFCSLESALYFNNDTDAKDWEYREAISYNNVKETVVAWTPVSESTITETPAGDKIRSNIRMVAYRVDGNDYPLKYGSFETQWYKYKCRSISGLTYYFEKEGYTDWGKWSDWSEKSEVPTEFIDVESRVVYRSRIIEDK